MSTSTDTATHVKDGHTVDSNTGMSSEKLGMWMFMSSEVFFFGAMIATYLLYLNRTNGGPTAEEIFDIPFTSASTFILLMSSLAMVLSLDGLLRKNQRIFQTWILTTALLGMTFLAGQFYEFTVFVKEGFVISTSPFSAAFYMLTGFHGVHVGVGVTMLLLTWVMSLRGKVSAKHAEYIEIMGLYWHFVDIVWIVIFTAIYLIPVG